MPEASLNMLFVGLGGSTYHRTCSASVLCLANVGSTLPTSYYPENQVRPNVECGTVCYHHGALDGNALQQGFVVLGERYEDVGMESSPSIARHD